MSEYLTNEEILRDIKFTPWKESRFPESFDYHVESCEIFTIEEKQVFNRFIDKFVNAETAKSFYSSQAKLQEFCQKLKAENRQVDEYNREIKQFMGNLSPDGWAYDHTIKFLDTLIQKSHLDFSFLSFNRPFILKNDPEAWRLYQKFDSYIFDNFIKPEYHDYIRSSGNTLCATFISANSYVTPHVDPNPHRGIRIIYTINLEPEVKVSTHYTPEIGLSENFNPIFRGDRIPMPKKVEFDVKNNDLLFLNTTKLHSGTVTKEAPWFFLIMSIDGISDFSYFKNLPENLIQ